MAKSQDDKLNNFNPNRERFSNFVVDLRQASLQTAQHLKIIENQIVKETKTAKRTWRLVRKEARHLRLDLLPRRTTSSFKSWSQFLSNWRPIFKKSYSHFSWRSIFTKRPQRGWLRKVKEQEKLLAARPIWPQSQRLALQTAQTRAKEAEEKVAWYRTALSFAFILLLIIVPIKLLSSFEFFDFQGLENKIRGRSELALNNLMAAADSISKLDFKQADSDFQAASANFLAAQEDLNKINDSLLALASLSNDPKMQLAAESKKFLMTGAIASSLGHNLVLATDNLFNGSKDDFPAALDGFLQAGNLAVKDAKELKKTMAAINPKNLPDAYQDKFTGVVNQVNHLADNLENFVAAGEKFKEVLGLNRDKRYLLVFQNNAELRASGGFLGSYALIDIRDGKIKNLEVPGGGSYDTEAGFNHLVAAPEPLWLVNPAWHFWDANWWPDWPTTAKNLMWFYEQSDGPSVDGVISVTPTVVESLLEITGPIDLQAEYGLVISADNFWQTVQLIVEQDNLAATNPEVVKGLATTTTTVISKLPLKQGLEVNAANKPKKIIGDLMAKILEVLPQKLTPDNLVKIITIFEKNMAEKQILFYFTDPTLQVEAASRNWAGEIKKTDYDYLLVVNTNIAGQKSDRLMTESIEQISEVASNGTIVNTVKITRIHQGIKNEPLTGVRNVDWLRIYVPLGSELISAEGFLAPDSSYLQERPEAGWEEVPLLAAEKAAQISPASGTKIYNENGKTVFANWLMVDPGQSGVVTLKYRLPFNFYFDSGENNWWQRLNAWLNPEAKNLIPYSLLVQKQPGAKASEFISRLVLPAGQNIFWRHPEELTGTTGWTINDTLNSDKYWSILVEENKK